MKPLSETTPSILITRLVCLALFWVAFPLLLFGLYYGAEPWIVLGIFGLGLSTFGFLTGESGMGAFAGFMLPMVLILVLQPINLVLTYRQLAAVSPQAEVFLDGNKLEDPHRASILAALRNRTWDPGNESKTRGDKWGGHPVLVLRSPDGEEETYHIGLMSQTPLIRRTRMENGNSGLILVEKLAEPLQELGYRFYDGEIALRETTPEPAKP